MDQTPASAANHALEACERMLRPIMRLALDRGLKYQDIDELIRDLMLDEAARDWAKRNGKEPSGSQLSVTTGINRKEVKRRLSETDNASPFMSQTRSLHSQVFMAWRLVVDGDPQQTQLEIVNSDPQRISFERLASKIVKDVHYRSILDELIRLGLVEEHGNTVHIVSNAFVPHSDTSGLLELAAANVGAHLHAVSANIKGVDLPFLEQAIGVRQVAADACNDLQVVARELWESSRKTLHEKMSALPEVGDSPHQMRIGMYAYFEAVKPKR